MGAGRLLAGPRAAALHREHGLLTRQAARDARELARVAERLDVEQDEVGARVVLPPLEQVVRRDVGLVADRDERGQAEPARLGPLEQREPERSRLRREADPAGREGAWGKGRVEADGGGCDPEAVGPDEARAVGAHERQQLLLAGDALGAGLGEARRDDAQRARPRAERFLGSGEHEVAGKADHAEVDLIADLLEGAVGTHSGDGGTGAVDGIGGAGEPTREDVAEQLAADRPAAGRGADHGHRAWLEERAQRCGHRDVVALVDSRAVALGRLDREPHLDHAAFERARRHEAGVREHREHRVVLGQDLGDERLDAVGGGALRQLLEQPGADALALELVGDGECRLGRLRVAEADVVPDADDALVGAHHP